MRLIGLGLLAFVIAGAAIALSYLEIWQRGLFTIQELTVGPQLVFEARHSAGGDTSTATVDAIAKRAGPEPTLLISGFPGYQKAQFLLPLSVDVVSGHLELNLTTQLSAEAEGVLRVNVNGSKRAEVVLRPGDLRRNLRIHLNDEDLSATEVRVTFAAEGRTGSPMCGPHDYPGSVIEIEDTSSLHLVVDAPIDDPEDRIRLWGDTTIISWPRWLESDERARRLALAGQLGAAGHSVIFRDGGDDGGLNTSALRTVADVAGSTAKAIDEVLWPVPVALDGANAGMRSFFRRASWRIAIDPRLLPERRHPSAIELSLTLGPIPSDADWTVVVTLNGSLLRSWSVDAFAGQSSELIELPESEIGRSTLEVTAIANVRRESLCDQGPELVAQMDPTTVLLPGEAIAITQIEALRSELSNFGDLQIELPESLSSAEAAKASTLVSNLVMPDSNVRIDPADRPTPLLTIVSDHRQLVGAQENDWLVHSEAVGAIPKAIPVTELSSSDIASVAFPAIVVTLPPEFATDGPKS